ncbi:hypothetical protein [Sphaerisporangium sp. NPDC051011]|uniref:hypothetical protein n=1 Tax=Sphaerisporangium sp. NPDC051011 TaxID=3155792 RepID=UPI0033CE19FE
MTTPPEALTPIGDIKPGDIIAGRDIGGGERDEPFGVVAEVQRDPWKVVLEHPSFVNGSTHLEASADWRLWVVNLPGPARQLLDLARAHGWRTLVNPATDTGGHVFVAVKVGRSRPWIQVDITWHTRDTGTFRLFSKLWRYVSADGLDRFYIGGSGPGDCDRTQIPRRRRRFRWNTPRPWWRSPSSPRPPRSLSAEISGRPSP